MTAKRGNGQRAMGDGDSPRARTRPAAAARRGTVLLLVVGVLALLATIAVLYAALGQGDRRQSAALTRQERIDSVVPDIADYLADVIARDVFDTTTEFIGGQPRSVRAAWDYPHTARTVPGANPANPRTVVSTNPTGNQARFNPSGSGAGDDPWLSDHEPTALRIHLQGNQPSINNRLPHLDLLDWRELSNFAPDGRFVNLWNLRNNFDAEPGFQQDQDQQWQISANLWRFDPNGTIRMLTPTVSRFPAELSSRRYFAHLPADDLDYAVSVLNLPSSVADPGRREYLPYSLADADGSGMFDSHWFELVDATDLNRPEHLLGGDGRVRWFIAARAVDLSGLVNVNTATDFADRPDRAYRAGLTPAEVDLRRVLRLADYWDSDGGDAWVLSYGDTGDAPGLRQPNSPRPSNYSEYDREAALIVGNSAYSALRFALRNPVDNPDWPRTAPPDVYFPDGGLFPGTDGPLDTEQRYDHYHGFGASPFDGFRDGDSVTTRAAFNLQDELELRAFNTWNHPGKTSTLEAVLGGRAEDYPDFSPLRDNRPREYERPRRAQTFDNDPYEGALLNTAIGVRHRLTTVSGARPLLSRSDPGTAIGEDDLRRDAFSLVRRAAREIDPDPSDLFTAYADALLPDTADFTNPEVVWQDNRYFTLSYGYDGPELPLRFAAHMTANIIDSYDKDNEPSAFTLLIDDSYRSVLDSLDPASDEDFPWWHQTSSRLDLEPDRLAPGSAVLLGPRAINVFGIEAQPFLTEVAAFIIYHASIENNSYDPMTDPDDPGPIVIRGNVPSGLGMPGGIVHPDFLGQFVAFQITNPFDHSINLTQADDNAPLEEDDFLYYVEFGGRYFRLVDRDEEGNLAPVTLNARESRVFFATNPGSLEAIQERWENAKPPGTANDCIATAGSEDVRRWINRQFGREDYEPIHIPRFNPSGGGVDVSADLMAGPDAAFEEVRLWRRMTSEQEQLQDTNWPATDLLADRLRVPDDDGNHFDRRLSNGDNEIANTLQDLPNQGDNTGYTIALWASVVRPVNPVPTSGDRYPRGAVPAYAVEVKDAWIAAGGTNSFNERGFDSVNKNNLSRADFTTARPNAATHFCNDSPPGFYNKTTETSDPDGPPTISRPPILVTLTQHPDNKNPSATTPLTDPPTNTYPRSLSQNLSGVDFHDVLAEIHLDNDEFTHPGEDTRILRVADMFLPLAVGPWSDPNAAAFEDRWTTLGESLAVALDYGSPGTEDLFYRIGATDEDPFDDPPILQRTDRGNLVLDNFVPFFDQNADGIFDPDTDTIVGRGIPMALNVLDMFRALSDADGVPYGDVARPVFGQININTAPISVLRALPMLSPPAADVDDQDWWWPAGDDSHFFTTDIAAAIAAYRDKNRVRPRGSPDDYDDNAVIDFRDGQSFDTNFYTGPRHFRSGIRAIREQPGFRSVGEIMAVRDRRFGTLDPNNPLYLHDIDRLGRDGEAIPFNNSDLAGLLFSTYGDANLPNQIRDSYDERLIIANAVLNSVSVRSDFFCVWFLLHGYTEADVQVEDNDPLVPSVQRRFVMVVDRSNVVTPGDRPRILLFQELPR